jgi:formyl-CoA transferase
MSGLMSVTGYPGSDPVKVGVPATDLTSGLFGAIGILNAYIYRLRTGVGQRVGASLFEAGLALAIHESNEYWSTGRVPGPLGSGHRFAAPYQSLRTKDGYVTVGAGTDKLWERFCAALGREDLLEDERFAGNAKRMEHIPELVEELEQTLATDTTDAWVDRIIAVGVPAGPLLNYQQVLEAEHTHARHMVVEYEHPRRGTLKTLGTPFKLSEVPLNGVQAAPMLAQHTDEVFGELGLAPERIAELREKGVL